MAIRTIVTRGYGSGATIPLVVLRGYIAAAAVAAAEALSTANLREYAALEMPEFLGGTTQADFATEVASLVSIVAEMGESATVAGTLMDCIGFVPYRGATMAGAEVEGRVTGIYVTPTAYDAAAAAVGSAVTFRSVAYTIGRVQRLDGGLVRLELIR